MKRKLALVKSSSRPAKPGAKGLLTDVRELILATRQTVAQGVNSALVILYWRIGRRIRTNILKDKRAGYGERIVATLSAQLMPDFGSGFAVRNLRRMIQFCEVFPDGEIVSTLSTQLNWSHFIELLPLNKPYQRDFYAEMCRIERWNVRTLRAKIDSMLFERTALSRRPELVARADVDLLRKEDQFTPDLVFRDPYILQFQVYPEKANQCTCQMIKKSPRTRRH